MNDWLLYSLLAGIGLAMISGALGCFVVWRRMSYFGDTLAHSALLGVVLGLILNVDVNIATIVCILLVSVLLVYFQSYTELSSDSLLGILAHSSLSISLVVISFTDKVRLDINAYLFGDILAVTIADLYWIYGCGTIVCFLLVCFWRSFLAMTIDVELAAIDGVNVARYQLLLTVMIAMVIAVAIKIVGVLLITSLMIIPAATVQRLANSPEQMLFGAMGLGCVSIVGGMASSWYLDSPTGPSIVVICFLFFVISLFLIAKRR